MENSTPKVESVVTGKVTVEKKTWLNKLVESTIGKYVVNDIVIPKVKSMTYDLVTSVVDMLLYGGTSPSRQSTTTRNNYVSYSNQYKTNTPKPVNTISGTDIFSMEKIRFESKRDAMAVLDQLCMILERYHIVTVAQFYDSANFTTDNVQANKFGWMDLSGVDVVRSYNGDYYINLPPASPID